MPMSTVELPDQMADCLLVYSPNPPMRLAMAMMVTSSI
jgi:hypothetical protein